jgi:hypothetical protein
MGASIMPCWYGTYMNRKAFVYVYNRRRVGGALLSSISKVIYQRMLSNRSITLHMYWCGQAALIHTTLAPGQTHDFHLTFVLTQTHSVLFMYLRTILCTFQISVDFYYVPVGGRGGGGRGAREGFFWPKWHSLRSLPFQGPKKYGFLGPPPWNGPCYGYAPNALKTTTYRTI